MSVNTKKYEMSSINLCDIFSSVRTRVRKWCTNVSCERYVIVMITGTITTTTNATTIIDNRLVTTNSTNKTMMQSDHSNHSSSPTPDQKIKTDLTTLTEQINLCQSILAQCPTPSSIDANESLLSTIGFLEACVPRMVELIDAAATGAFSEEIF
jgi:hypothetical protein